jgi:chromosome segregation protein
MHLRSITLKGFKSFPDRTRLEFAPGVSVVVGPNGSGKSNLTDAVLWALGEQSPLAVRGQSMQDVIFAGGHGVQARSEAEVEVVLDNGDAAVDLPLSEISIVRRLSRAGEGEYRVNGARCRLTDVLELMSDTGLGKEMHSVVSQGRVEAIVTSKPRDRRLLIEEAAGLGKHRKRRRRAQLKLDRTQDNLSRALDVEREARLRLRPLKRQAEAAELHERLARQTAEARWALERDALRSALAAVASAEGEVAAARAAYGAAEAELRAVAARREAAETALAERGTRREALAARAYAARSAHERLGMREESARRSADDLADRSRRRAGLIRALEAEAEGDVGDDEVAGRIATLEAELAGLEEDRAARLAREVAALEERRTAAGEEVERRRAAAAAAASARGGVDAAAEAARRTRREREAAADAARRASAQAGAELAAVNQFLRTQAGAPGGAPALADALRAQPGCELALAAALGPRLRAAVATDLAHAAALLEGAGHDGGAALVAPHGVPSAGATPPAATPPSATSPNATPPVALSAATPPAAMSPGATPPAATPPAAEAEPLLARVHVDGDGPVAALAQALLADVWLVRDVAALPPAFAGIAVTRDGRVWSPTARELRQVPAGGEDRVLAERNRRDELVTAVERAAQAEHTARAAVTEATSALQAAEAERDEADRAARAAGRALAEAEEAERHAGWLVAERRRAPDEGPAAERRAQLESALRAERRLAERAERERRERGVRLAREHARLAAERALEPLAERLCTVLRQAAEAVAGVREGLEAELAADRAAGEELARALRACAAEESRGQAGLRDLGEAVTRGEVALQRARDRAEDARGVLGALAAELGLSADPAQEPLPADERTALEGRLERLARRREQLGPVNPLAQAEYAEALEHVEELERRREDLEAALRELEAFIADTDRAIREAFEQTFAAAARNFEEVAEQLFPGGRGRLRLVRDSLAPRPVLGGGDADDAPPPEDPEDDDLAADEHGGAGPDEDMGVEIEITPEGKATKRLTLLSGGEKSLTALAFLFAVFLARPCPFYILDEVEAALDDLNIDRFLTLLRRFSGRAQFIVVTHQKRTMEAADCLYGVSMAGNGVSKVVSRRLPPRARTEAA